MGSEWWLVHAWLAMAMAMALLLGKLKTREKNQIQPKQDGMGVGGDMRSVLTSAFYTYL